MDNIYKDIDKCSPGIVRKVTIVFDDMIADMVSNNKRNSIVAELFIRGIEN